MTIHDGIEVVTARAVDLEKQILELNEELIQAREQIQPSKSLVTLATPSHL